MEATARQVQRMDCPHCGKRIFDKEEGAYGFTREKCRVCKSTWRVNLGTNEFILIAGTAVQRR